MKYIDRNSETADGYCESDQSDYYDIIAMGNPVAQIAEWNTEKRIGRALKKEHYADLSRIQPLVQSMQGNKRGKHPQPETTAKGSKPTCQHGSIPKKFSGASWNMCFFRNGMTKLFGRWKEKEKQDQIQN